MEGVRVGEASGIAQSGGEDELALLLVGDKEGGLHKTVSVGNCPEGVTVQLGLAWGHHPSSGDQALDVTKVGSGLGEGREGNYAGSAGVGDADASGTGDGEQGKEGLTLCQLGDSVGGVG